jgi:hypothetical protein
MLKNRLLKIVCITLLGFSMLHAQDTLWTTGREAIPAKVLEIGIDSIYFRSPPADASPAYSISKDHVWKIKFKSGTVEELKKAPAAAAAPAAPVAPAAAPGTGFTPQDTAKSAFAAQSPPKSKKKLGKRAGFFEAGGGYCYNDILGGGGAVMMRGVFPWFYFGGSFSIMGLDEKEIKVNKTFYDVFMSCEIETGPSIQIIAKRYFRWIINGGLLMGIPIYRWAPISYENEYDMYYNDGDYSYTIEYETGAGFAVGPVGNMALHFRKPRGVGLGLESQYKYIYEAHFFSFNLLLTAR